ncbi:acid phosphatase AphA [Actinobacillus delphinicola]|uniref:acid phosphatase AphA n=1 Tax=Actinobacillus delphinicola TaxID=51161 RepID=UPI002441B3F2|nr:acid phosphatase AphA [Actinobacillus delphinicola]MDG6896755.1 acid phosphatase AphA [Actinobacillus delphinicola]
MNKNIKLLALAVALGTTVSFSANAKVNVPYTNQGFYTNAPSQVAVHFVSVKDIENSLKDQKPMTVTFDIDDTLVFSSSYFHYGFDFGKEMGWGSTPKEVLHSQKFWDYVADSADKLSIPKESAKKIIAMHLKRGDKIVFITGRTPRSDAKNGTVTETSRVLQKYFNMPYPPVIWYTSDTPRDGYKFDKTYYLKKVGSSLHYGDSDVDILAAREAGIRGIRVQRSASSTNPQNLNGGYGEEVVINSSW